MSQVDNPPANGGQEPSAGVDSPPAGGQEPQGGGEQQQPEPQVFSADYVKGLRGEAAKWRTTVRDLEDKVKGFEQEKMSETERLQAQLAEAQKKASEATATQQQALAQVAIAQEAASVGLSVNLATKLVQVEFDAEGQPVDVKEAIAQLVKDYPQLVNKQPAGSTTSPANPPRGKKGALTREIVENMSVQEVMARKDEIDTWLAGQ